MPYQTIADVNRSHTRIGVIWGTRVCCDEVHIFVQQCRKKADNIIPSGIQGIKQDFPSNSMQGSTVQRAQGSPQWHGHGKCYSTNLNSRTASKAAWQAFLVVGEGPGELHLQPSARCVRCISLF